MPSTACPGIVAVPYGFELIPAPRRNHVKDTRLVIPQQQQPYLI